MPPIRQRRLSRVTLCLVETLATVPRLKDPSVDTSTRRNFFQRR